MEQAIRVTALLCLAACICFGGYRLRRALVTVGGVVGGAALGFVLARLMELPVYWWGVGMALGFGIALGLLAFRLHKLGLFLLCGACAMGYVYHLLQTGTAGVLEPWIIWAAAVMTGLIVGVLVYRFYRPAVIVTTALFGGMLFWTVAFELLSQAAAVQYFGQAVGLATGILGAVWQFRGRR